MRFLLQLTLLTALYAPLSVSAQSADSDCWFCSPWFRWAVPLPDVELPETPPAPPLVEVFDAELARNPRASYCKRDPDIIDTIVFHHSATSASTSVEWINDFHMERGTAANPWYMIAYHYAISSAYTGTSSPATKTYQGRPLEIVGAHAGTDKYAETSAETRQRINDTGITCGKDGGAFTRLPNRDIFNSQSNAKANQISIGVVIIGNYAAYSRYNLTGYRGPVRYPSDGTLEEAGKLACQIQREHPRVKRITWHSMYNSTSCPGSIKDRLDKIREIARGYGCEFQ